MRARVGALQFVSITARDMYGNARSRGGDRFARARESCLSITGLQTIAGLKRQLLELLSEAHFVRRGLRASLRRGL